MAWELLTKVYGLPKDRLYVTYFEGDAKLGVEPDNEARDLWLSVGVAEDHILTGDAKDNFWEMGATGPCGPCSEIHYDRIGGGRNAAHLVNQDDPNVLEIWNNVFMAYNREADGSLRPLPAKHIDTGMGFERLVSCLQDKPSNYDTDVFAPIFAKIQELTNAKPYSGKLGKDDVDGIDTAYRVVADHVRTLTFALSDGGVPDRDGRGYVLRRILRRGTRYVRKYFQVPIGQFFSQLVPTVVAEMGHFFPEITKKVAEIQAILDEEEDSFSRTLDRGEKVFEQYASRAKQQGLKELGGKDVWRLYDTFGFPVDLTLIMAEEQGLGVNEAEFEKAQADSKEASKGGEKAQGPDLPKFDVHDLGALEQNDAVPKTDDSAKFGRGNVNATIKAIYQGSKFVQSSEEVDKTKPLGILLDKTNFYAEQGGQMGDTGSIVIDGQTEFVVEDCQVFSGYVLHSGRFNYGSFKVGDAVVAGYDELRRWPLRNNHTGTHILNYGLREVLGDHIDQKGSLVAPTKLRYDFSHKALVGVPELKKIEDIGNEWVKKNVPVYSAEMPLELAYKIPGVRAVFGEAYPDPVRVVSLEYDVKEIAKDVENPKWRNSSIEFCGGTHVEATGDIRQFVIVEESGIAKGIRRIVAVTGQEAAQVTRQAEELERQMKAIDTLKDKAEKEAKMKTFAMPLAQAEISSVRKADLLARFQAMKRSFDAEVKARTAEESKLVENGVKDFFATESPNAQVLVRHFDVNANNKALAAGVNIARKLGKSVYLFSQDAAGVKVAHVNFVAPQDMERGVDAKAWAEQVANIVGGKSGGKQESAQGVGDKAAGDALAQAIKAAQTYFDSKTQ